MTWIKVPPKHHPIFHAALPNDPRVETRQMFGGIAAKVNGHVFAGLFGRSTMIWLPESDRADALALPGAAPFDPMGDGRAESSPPGLDAVPRPWHRLTTWLRREYKLRSTSAIPTTEDGHAPSRARRHASGDLCRGADRTGRPHYQSA